MKQFRIIGLESIPEIHPSDDLVNIIVDSCVREGVQLENGDVIIITSKIVSKAEGSVVDLSKVKASRRARAIARLSGKDPVEVEIILRNSAEISAIIPVKKIMESNPSVLQNISTDKETAQRVVRSVPSMLLTVTNQGTLATDAGLDYSNNRPGTASLLPKDPSSSAERIRDEISKIVGINVAVVITDTEIAFTNFSGSTEVAIGYSGIRPVAQMFGSKDRFGREKFGGADIIVDELACAAALLAGQTSEGIPVVIVKGLKYPKEEAIERPPNHGEALKKGLRWTLLSTLKLRFLAIVELFV